LQKTSLEMKYLIQMFSLLVIALILFIHSGCSKEPTCSDGKQNQGELGIDCCGPCNPCNNLPCEIGFVPSCVDGVMNGDETNVDCGGDCPACGSLCNDGVQNGSETGVDCGGSCQPCGTPPTCLDGILNGAEEGVDCGGGTCPPCGSVNNCANGVQDGNETGVDCGGACSPCTAEPSCNDGIQNQDEAGIDCGGPCTAICTSASCSDGIQNQGESGIDCGGPCNACIPSAMTAIINGINWVADEITASALNGVILSISGTATDGSMITLSYGGSFEVGIGEIGTLTTAQLLLAGTADPCLAATVGSGSITFTTFDIINKIVSGSFEFNCTIDDETNDVTTGIFTNISYQ